MTYRFTLLDGRSFVCAPDAMLTVADVRTGQWHECSAGEVASTFDPVTGRSGSVTWGWPAVPEAPVAGVEHKRWDAMTRDEAWLYGVLLTDGELGVDVAGEAVLHFHDVNRKPVDVALYLPEFDEDYVGPVTPGMHRVVGRDDVVTMTGLHMDLLRVPKDARRVDPAWFTAPTKLRFWLLQGIFDGAGRVVDSGYKSTWSVMIEPFGNMALLGDIHRLVLEYGFEAMPAHVGDMYKGIAANAGWWAGCEGAHMRVMMDHSDKVRMFTRPDAQHMLSLPRSLPAEQRGHSVLIVDCRQEVAVAA